MSLLPNNTKTLNNISLQGIKLPTSNKREVGIDMPLKIEKPPTDKAIDYRKLLSINPELERLVEVFDLGDKETLKPLPDLINKTKQTVELEPILEPTDIKRGKLISLACKSLKTEERYSKEAVISLIIKQTKVKTQRAEKGFNLMLEAGAIKRIEGGKFSLIVSPTY